MKQLLKNEVEQLKNLLKEYEKEIQFYREQTQVLQRDKDSLRAGLENFVQKNSSLGGSQTRSLNESDSYAGQRGNSEEMERLEIERKKLKVKFIAVCLINKEALNQAKNEIDAYKQRENEYEITLQKKDKQIQNLVNSRNMMQATLAEQVFSQK